MRPRMDAGSDGEPSGGERGLVDIGWILVRPLEDPDLEALARAAASCRARLQDAFPELTFRISTVGPRNVGIAQRTDIVSLLEQAATERTIRRWDFVFVMTGADLETRYRPYAFGATARSLASAVISTFRIDPEFAERETEPAERAARMADRVVFLFSKGFGLLNGLGSRDEPSTVMGPTAHVRDLDRGARYDPEQARRLEEALVAVADPRVEEEAPQEGRRSRLRFYLRAFRASPETILGSVRQARPWLLPFRLSRLTAAAFSALVVLMITAEVWQLGSTQSPGTVLFASLVSWLGTTTYVVQRRRPSTDRSGLELVELAAQNRISTTVVIAVGMAVTYALLFVTAFGVGLSLFGASLVEGWVPSLDAAFGVGHRLAFSGTVAALGLVAGALGASFEQQDYLGHVAQVDEEF